MDSVQILVKPFRPTTLFAAIRWNGRSGLWDSRNYKDLVEHNRHEVELGPRGLQRDSISQQSVLYKATVETARLACKAEAACLVLQWLSRDALARKVIHYEDVALIQSSGLQDLFVGGELLGHELTRSDGMWRHAMLFIANEYLLVESKTVSWTDAQPFAAADGFAVR